MTSNTTTSSGSVARARAKAEAAKVRASYAAQEAKLKMEKAVREAEIKVETTRIETELEVLTLQKEAEAATVEAQVMEMAQTTLMTEVEERQSEKAESERAKMERTHDYVQDQIEIKSLSPSQPTLPRPVVHSPDDKSLDSYVTGTLAPNLRRGDVSHQSQLNNSQPNPEKEESMHLPPANVPAPSKQKKTYLSPLNLPDLPKIRIRSEDSYLLT